MCRDVAPSLLVLTSIKLSDYICKTKTDDKILKDCFKYEKDEMSSCFKNLCNVLQNKNKYGLLALKKKYSTEKYHGVSKVKIEPK